MKRIKTPLIKYNQLQMKQYIDQRIKSAYNQNSDPDYHCKQAFRKLCYSRQNNHKNQPYIYMQANKEKLYRIYKKRKRIEEKETLTNFIFQTKIEPIFRNQSPFYKSFYLEKKRKILRSSPQRKDIKQHFLERKYITNTLMDKGHSHPKNTLLNFCPTGTKQITISFKKNPKIRKNNFTKQNHPLNNYYKHMRKSDANIYYLLSNSLSPPKYKSKRFPRAYNSKTSKTVYKKILQKYNLKKQRKSIQKIRVNTNKEFIIRSKSKPQLKIHKKLEKIQSGPLQQLEKNESEIIEKNPNNRKEKYKSQMAQTQAEIVKQIKIIDKKKKKKQCFDHNNLINKIMKHNLQLWPKNIKHSKKYQNNQQQTMFIQGQSFKNNFLNVENQFNQANNSNIIARHKYIEKLLSMMSDTEYQQYSEQIENYILKAMQ